MNKLKFIFTLSIDQSTKIMIVLIQLVYSLVYNSTGKLIRFCRNYILSSIFFFSLFFGFQLFAKSKIVFQADTSKKCHYQSLLSKPNVFTGVLDSLKKIDKLNRKNRSLKEVKLAYESILEQQKGFINSRMFLFDTLIYPFANSILENIKAANSKYDLFNHVVISRSRIPNAYCYGNGVIVINLGILSFLKNEDQLAALIGHEYAHHVMQHMEKGIEYKKAHYQDKETKKKLRKINRTEIAQNANYEQFELENAMVYRAQNRALERQADSLGFELLKKTDYSKKAALDLLRLLDSCDLEKYNYKLDYSQIFSNGEYEFNSKLLLDKAGMELEEKQDQSIIDALKTHPDCKERIENINNLFNSNEEKPSPSERDISSIGKISDYEMLFSDIENKRFALCIKNALLFQKEEKDKILEVLIANCLAELYFAQKNHLLWNYIPHPSDDYIYNYHQLLVIIENIRLSELKKLTLAYIEKVNSDIGQNTMDCGGYVEYLKLQQKSIIENSHPSEEQKEIIKLDYPNNSFLVN